jgi:hypothetical protein
LNKNEKKEAQKIFQVAMKQEFFNTRRTSAGTSTTTETDQEKHEFSVKKRRRPEAESNEN